MRTKLAQRLLARVMEWDETRLLQEQDVIQTLADYKYDSYEGFDSGVKFIESLAQWLSQFDKDDRPTAYRLLRDHLIYVSRAEMLHLVRSIYPDIVVPTIRKAAADSLGIPWYQATRIESAPQFKDLLRRCLFLGLSDGARMDVFRRSSTALDNEQIHLIYDLTDTKAADMQMKLMKALGHDDEPQATPATFRFVFLLDDFAGTGQTLLRERNGCWEGRLVKIADKLGELAAKGMVDSSEVDVIVCLCVATADARQHLSSEMRRFDSRAWSSSEVRIVHEVGEEAKVPQGADAQIDRFLDKYYSKDLEDRESYRVGNCGIKYGYSACSQTIVIHHNAPNNSLFPLWKQGNDRYHFSPLFPRFERHP